MLAKASAKGDPHSLARESFSQDEDAAAETEEDALDFVEVGQSEQLALERLLVPMRRNTVRLACEGSVAQMGSKHRTLQQVATRNIQLTTGILESATLRRHESDA